MPKGIFRPLNQDLASGYRPPQPPNLGHGGIIGFNMLSSPVLLLIFWLRHFIPKTSTCSILMALICLEYVVRMKTALLEPWNSTPGTIFSPFHMLTGF